MQAPKSYQNQIGASRKLEKRIGLENSAFIGNYVINCEKKRSIALCLFFRSKHTKAAQKLV